MTPQKHKVDWNGDLPPDQQRYPAVPTLFELAKQAGYTTGLAAGKSKFVALAKDDSVDWKSIPDKKAPDADVASAVAKIVAEHRPDVMFVHLAGPDNVGHATGWGTPEQLQAVATADAAVGQVLAAYDAAGIRGQTLVILSADHGGAGRNHGPDDPRSRHIPWIVAGPGVRPNLDLTTYQELVVNTEDTFATACYVLGIAMSADVDGKPITQAFVKQELLQAAP